MDLIAQLIPKVQYSVQGHSGWYEPKECKLYLPEEEGTLVREAEVIFEQVKLYKGKTDRYLLWKGETELEDGQKPLFKDTKETEGWWKKPDAYRMQVSKGGIILEAFTVRGFFYGIRTLQKLKRLGEGLLPFCEVTDWADVALRCDYLEFRNFYPKLEHVYNYLEQMADRHINAILVEMEDKRPFLSPTLKGLQNKENGFSLEAVRTLEKKAAELFIELIPLQQSFGHLEYVLKQPEYIALRELPESAGELCPSNNGSIRLVEELLKDMKDLFPRSSYLHLGCDEVWSLGSCKKCIESGLTRHQLFIHYINHLIDFVCRMGKTPLFWHDMLMECTTEELKELDSRAIVVLWMYDGNDMKKRAAVMLDKMREAGICIWGGCAVRCWDCSGFQNYPLLANRKNNITQWAELCEEYALEGMVNTNWSAYSALAYPYGIYETSIYPATFAAEQCWNRSAYAEDFLGRYLRYYHRIDPKAILEEGMQFEDYYHVAANLDQQEEAEEVDSAAKEARWYWLVEAYEDAVKGNFPAVLQMFRVALYPRNTEEWDSMRQRYKKTFQSLKELHPQMKQMLEEYMEPEVANVYLYSRYYLWELYEREILCLAQKAGVTGFVPILTERIGSCSETAEKRKYDETI